MKGKGEVIMKLRERLPDFPSTSAWLNGSIDKDYLIGQKPILVFIWSVSCQSCEGTVKWVEKLKQKYENRFQIVGVHMPRLRTDTDRRAIKEKAARLGMTYPILLDHDTSYSKLLGTQTVPNFYLFDKKGLFRHRQSGEVGLRLLEQKLVTIINEMT